MFQRDEINEKTIRTFLILRPRNVLTGYIVIVNFIAFTENPTKIGELGFGLPVS